MRLSRTHWFVIAVWTACFLFCLLVPLVVRRDIPTVYGDLMNQAVDSFAPGLSAMFAVAFTVGGRAQSRKIPKSHAALSVALAVSYCLVLSAFWIQFVVDEAFTAAALTEVVQQVRPKISFFAAAVTGYLFAGRVETPNAG